MSRNETKERRKQSPRRRSRRNNTDNKHNNAKNPGGERKRSYPSNSTAKWNADQLSTLFRSFVSGAASSAAVKFTSGLGAIDEHEDKTPTGSVGEFDLYLFAQTWAPRFCCLNAGKCMEQGKDGIDDLTVHGLWPAYTVPKGNEGRTYPAYCPLGKIRQFSTNDRLASHEYIKHGSCTNMSFETYVDEELRIEDDGNVSVMRDMLNSRAGDIVSIDDIFQVAGGNKRVAIQTTSHCQLQELTTCWSKAADGSVGEQVDCPAHVLGSGRNSALLNRCSKISLDASNDEMKCSYITKEMLKLLKT